MLLMIRLRKYQIFVTGLLLVYFFVTYVIAVTPIIEVFPFFSGRWFYKVPHTFQDFGIKAISENGQPLPDESYLDQNRTSFKNSWPFRRYVLSQNLGRNIEEKNTEAIKKDISTLRMAIFQSKDVQFKVDRRTFNSLDYVKTGKIVSAETIFSSEYFKNE